MSDAPQPLETWAWAHEDAARPRPEPVADRVVAVLVVRNGAAWLPAALSALAAQTRRPDRVVAVDNGSTDATPAQLRQALAAGTVDAVRQGDADWGFGRAVEEAVRLDAAAGEPAPAWWWLLHDDATADPDCLEQLLVHVAEDPTIDVTGPKLLMPSRRFAGRQISEMGASIASSGARVLSLSPGEIDQGQHTAKAVLGLSTCGMLVRAAVLEKLGGFDEAVPLYRNGVELGWRANLAGHRVVTSPKAVMTHRQVGRAGARPGVPGSPTAQDQAYGMITVAAHRTGVPGFATAAGMVLRTLLRALGFLLGKAPGRAAEEMRALRIFLGSTSDAFALRRRIKAIHVADVDAARVRRLRPGRFSGVVRGWEGIATWFSETWGDVVGHRADTSIDELTGDDFADQRRGSRARRPWALPTAVVMLAVALLAVVAGRSLIAPGHLTGPLLLPAQDNLLALVRDYVSGIPGAPGQVAPPWVGLLVVGSVLTLGQPEALVTILVMGCVPLATLAGHAYLRQLSTDRRTRLVGSVGYGLLPALLGAINRGDLGLVVASLVLPLLGRSVLAWRRRGTSTFERWRGPAAVGLWLTILSAFSPMVWLLALVGGLAVGLRDRRHLARIGLALAIPLVLLSPWIPTLVAHPGRLVTGYDPIMRGTAPVSTLGLLVGRTPAPGLPPLWVSIAFFAVLWLLGLLGLALRPRAGRGWALLCLGALATAVIVTRFVLLVPMADEPARPQAGMWLLIAFAALLSLVAEGWDHVQRRLAQHTFGVRQGVSVGALILATLAAVLGAGWWVAAGETGPVHRTTFASVPAFARQTQASVQGLRTLTIDLGESEPRWDLTEGDGTRLGDTERGEAFGGGSDAMERTRVVVADLATGHAEESVTEELVRLGIGHVWVRDASADALAQIGTVPGLAQVTADEHARVWRVTPLRSRAMLATGADVVAVAGSGSTIEPGQAGRRLVLAEQPDPRWRATLDGRELPRVEVADDDRPWFVVGDGGGVLRWELRGTPWWAWAQLAGLVLLAVLAAPSLRRTDQRDPELFARRAARLDQDGVNA